MARTGVRWRWEPGQCRLGYSVVREDRKDASRRIAGGSSVQKSPGGVQGPGPHRDLPPRWGAARRRQPLPAHGFSAASRHRGGRHPHLLLAPCALRPGERLHLQSLRRRCGFLRRPGPGWAGLSGRHASLRRPGPALEPSAEGGDGAESQPDCGQVGGGPPPLRRLPRPGGTAGGALRSPPSPGLELGPDHPQRHGQRLRPPGGDGTDPAPVPRTGPHRPGLRRPYPQVRDSASSESGDTGGASQALVPVLRGGAEHRGRRALPADRHSQGNVGRPS